MTNLIKKIKINDRNAQNYPKQYVGCIVKSFTNKIVLQQRGVDWDRFPGYLATFGGEIEKDETPAEALVRELNEELGALVKPKDIVSLGAITEKISNYSELIYAHFWHDTENTITGCYEGTANYYDNYREALNHPKKTDNIIYLLDKCVVSGLIS